MDIEKARHLISKVRLLSTVCKEAINASFYFTVISLLHKKEHMFIIQIQEQNVPDRKEAA